MEKLQGLLKKFGLLEFTLTLIAVYFTLKLVSYLMLSVIGYRNVSIAIFPGNIGLDEYRYAVKTLEESFFDKYCKKDGDGFYRVDALRILPGGDLEVECKSVEIQINGKYFSYAIRIPK